MGRTSDADATTAAVADQFADWDRRKTRHLFERRVAAALPFLPGSGRVLDAGCGDGETIARFTAARPDLAFVGLDLRHFTPRPGLVRGDLQQLPFAAGAFAAVVMLAAIEHVPDHDRAFAEAARVLAEGGRLVLTTPNPRFARAAAVAARLGLKFREGFDNGLDLRQLARLAAAHGLVVRQARGFLVAPWPGPLDALEPRLAASGVGRWLLLNQLFVAEKPSRCTASPSST